MRKLSIYFLCVCIVFLMFLTGCSNETTSEDIKTKATYELQYLDSEIISIVNKLNNISLQSYTITSEEVALSQESSAGGSSSGGGQSSSGGQSGNEQQSNSQNKSGENSQNSNITVTQMKPETVLASDKNAIDWDSIKNKIETISESWAVVIVDLSNLNVDNEDILGFSDTMDNCILSIKDENKSDALINIAKLYSYIPRFEKAISTENSSQNVKQVKSNIINAYSLVEQDDWSGIQTNISECERIFTNLLNDLEYIKDKEYKVNRTYVLIKELQNSLTYRDKDLFYVKYKNLMESIETL